MDEHAEGIETIGTATNGARGLSLLKEAERRREERERSFFLDIPSWEGDLIGEYRIVPSQDLKRIAERQVRRLRNGEQDAVRNDIDIIVAANIGLYMRDPESGDRVPIEDEFGHVGYGRIAHTLGKEDEIKSQAEAVRYLMAERKDDGSWEENAVAIGIHAQSITRWMRDPSKRALDLEEILGES